MKDADVVHRVRCGELEAFSELVDHYQNAVYGLAYHHLHNFEDARDVAQETFIHAFVGLERLRDPARFGPWLRQTAINQCRMWHRQHRVTEALDAAPSLASLGEQVETRMAVQQALSCLSDTTRLTVTLFYMESLSLQETATFLEVPVTTVKSRLRDARARLKKEMWTMVEDTLKQERLPLDFVQGVEQLIDELHRLHQAGEQEKAHELLATSPYSEAAVDELGRRGELQRFTEHSRRIILRGQEQASQRNCTCVDPEHLLLALTRESVGYAAQLLQDRSVTYQTIQQEIEATQQPGITATKADEPADGAPARNTPELSEQSKRVLESAAEEAKRIAQHLGIPGDIHPEHLLLALSREESGIAAHVLQKLGFDLESTRDQVMDHWRTRERT